MTRLRLRSLLLSSISKVLGRTRCARASTGRNQPDHLQPVRINMFLHDVNYESSHRPWRHCLPILRTGMTNPFEAISLPIRRTRSNGWRCQPVDQRSALLRLPGCFAPKSKADLAFTLHI